MEISVPVSKKARVAGVVFPMIFGNNEASFLKSYPDVDLEGERLICLSQTERKATDSGAEGRDAIVVTQKTNGLEGNRWETLLKHNVCLTYAGKNIAEKGLRYHDWNLSLVHQNYSIITCQTIVSVEAFKELEKEFSELLAGMGGMAENHILMQKLKNFVKNTADTLSIPLILPEWYNQLPFGIFAVALRELMTIESSEVIVMERKEMLISEVRPFFLDIVRCGTECLENEHPDLDDQSRMAVQFMKNEENFEEVVFEWAFIGKMRAQRNSLSHPFSRNSEGTREPSLELFERTLYDKFSDSFRNVGLLALANLKSVIIRKELKKIKNSENHIMLLKEGWTENSV